MYPTMHTVVNRNFPFNPEELDYDLILRTYIVF